MLRGVSIKREAWPVRFVKVAGAEVAVGGGTFQPFFLELPPGYHSVDLLDRGHHVVESKSFALRANQVVTVRVFPPTSAVWRTGSSTRELLTVETDELGW